VADDVAVGQADHGDVLDRLEARRDVGQAGDAGQQVGLVGVAGHHHGRVPAQPGQQHLQLHVGAVLGLVDDHEGVVQGAAAHEADRGDLDRPLGHQGPHPLDRQPVAERVVERPQIGGQLVLHVAGQVADRLAGLDGGARQHNAADLAGLQGFDGLGDGDVGLAGAGRAQGHDQVLVVDGLHQPRLAWRFGFYGFEIALVALLVSWPAAQWRPCAAMLHRQAAHLGVVVVARIIRTFAHGPLESSLGHESLHSGMKKGRGRMASSLEQVGRKEAGTRARPGGSELAPEGGDVRPNPKTDTHGLRYREAASEDRARLGYEKNDSRYGSVPPRIAQIQWGSHGL
jgi:hypothetical protein